MYHVNFPCVGGILPLISYKTKIKSVEVKEQKKKEEKKSKTKKQKKPIIGHQTLPHPYKSLTTNFVAR